MPRLLLARGHTRLGGGDLRWALAFAQRMWGVVVEREGLLFDTSLVPASEGSARPRACVYLLLGGRWELRGDERGRFDAPAAMVLSDEQLEGAAGARPFTFLARGAPYRSVQLHLDVEDLVTPPADRPVLVTLDEVCWATAQRTARLAQHDDERLEAAFTRLLEHLGRAGVLRPGVAERVLRPPATGFALLWRALRPMVERFYLTATLQEVVSASGLSARQLDRRVQAFVGAFGLSGDGWRQATRHLRIKIAVILLSADDATMTAVAGAVGYGSVDAMARAFRDAGLPAPTAVQQRLHATK